MVAVLGIQEEGQKKKEIGLLWCCLIIPVALAFVI